MRKIGNFICIFAVMLAFSFTLVGCKNQLDTSKISLQLCSILGETIQSDELFELLNIPIDYNDERNKLIADYSSPTNTYELHLPDKYSILKAIFSDKTVLYDALSDNVKEQLLGSVSMKNAYNIINGNTSELQFYHLSTTYIATKEYNATIDEDIALLYFFENGSPIVVTFAQIKEEVIAEAQFLNVPNNFATLTEIFEPFGVKVVEIK